ncbi:ABC transporter ATP-binding protein [Methylobacterium sp. A54F]
MERDPILFAWRSAPGRHAAAVALSLGLGGPLTVFVLLCISDLVGTLTRDEAPALPFLRLVLHLQGGDRVILGGIALSPADLEFAAFTGLSLAALALAGLGWVVARLCFAAQTRGAGRLHTRATDAILTAPAAARDDVRSLAGAVGDALRRVDGLLAVGILAPALALGAVVMALGLAALAAPRLVPVAAVGLLAGALARTLILQRERARTDLRAQANVTAERTLADLVRRMPAVRGHGTADQERLRLKGKIRARRTALGRAEARLAYARAPALALAVVLPAIALGTALWRSGLAPNEVMAAQVEPGPLAAAFGAFAIAALLLAVAIRLWFVREAVAPVFREIARLHDGLETRRTWAGSRGTPFPEGGSLVARGVGAYDAGSGERLSGVDLAVGMPAHIAITGGRGSGARVLAAVLAGHVEPTAGAVAYGGADLRTLDPAERARRIAFAAGEAILIKGTLGQNILYGTDPGHPPDEAEFVRVLRLTGLDAFVYTRGLGGRVDPASDPELARAVVAARRATRDALRADRAERLVESFDPAHYNHQATVGENILFGEAVDGTFAEAELAGHPYMRAILEAEDLTRPLQTIGLAVAQSLVEIFADLPNDHPLFDAFSLFPAAERAYFEDLVARQQEAKGWRRGPPGQRDRERLIGLALRYSETRHRFGLIDAAFEARLVSARHTFARMLPPHLVDKVEFYDPGRLNPAASLEENLLFGRIAHGEAGAEARVRALIRRILAEQGLERAVYRLGLDSAVEPGAAGSGLGEGAIGARERVAVDLARCLIRRPDILVVAILLDERKPDDFRERLAALRAARSGLGLIVCLPDDDVSAMDPFDAVIGVARNMVVPHEAAAAA